VIFAYLLSFHQYVRNYVRFKVLTAANMQIRAVWVIAPCSLVGIHRRFRDAFCLNHQGNKCPDDESFALIPGTWLRVIYEMRSVNAS
jgi:hypothetical protein